MKFRIINSEPGRWGEGWVNGDIVDLDWQAAKVALESGEIEIYEENSNGVPASDEKDEKSGTKSAKVKVAKRKARKRKIV
jgi:hypothetical protein